MQSYLLELAFTVCELLLLCQHCFVAVSTLFCCRVNTVLLPRQQCSVDTATKTNRYRDREQKMWKLGDKQSGRCTQRPYCWMLPLTVYRLTVNGGTVKQVLFCGFQRQRKPTLAERKICVFCGFL